MLLGCMKQEQSWLKSRKKGQKKFGKFTIAKPPIAKEANEMKNSIQKENIRLF